MAFRVSPLANGSAMRPKPGPGRGKRGVLVAVDAAPVAVPRARQWRNSLQSFKAFWSAIVCLPPGLAQRQWLRSWRMAQGQPGSPVHISALCRQAQTPVASTVRQPEVRMLGAEAVQRACNADPEEPHTTISNRPHKQTKARCGTARSEGAHLWRFHGLFGVGRWSTQRSPQFPPPWHPDSESAKVAASQTGP